MKAAARCSCGARKEGTLVEVNDWARAHDDSPGTKHIVSWAGEGFAWPVEAYAFPPPDHVDLMALIREGRKANA